MPPLPAAGHSACGPYLRFTLSYRDVENLLAERGLDISYEIVRWVGKLGSALMVAMVSAPVESKALAIIATISPR